MNLLISSDSQLFESSYKNYLSRLLTLLTGQLAAQEMRNILALLICLMSACAGAAHWERLITDDWQGESLLQFKTGNNKAGSLLPGSVLAGFPEEPDFNGSLTGWADEPEHPLPWLAGADGDGAGGQLFIAYIGQAESLFLAVIAGYPMESGGFAQQLSAFGLGMFGRECTFVLFPGADLATIFSVMPRRCQFLLTPGVFPFYRTLLLKDQQTLQTLNGREEEVWTAKKPLSFTVWPDSGDVYPAIMGTLNEVVLHSVQKAVLKPGMNFRGRFGLVLGDESHISSVVLDTEHWPSTHHLLGYRPAFQPLFSITDLQLLNADDLVQPEPLGHTCILQLKNDGTGTRRCSETPGASGGSSSGSESDNESSDSRNGEGREEGEEGETGDASDDDSPDPTGNSLEEGSEAAIQQQLIELLAAYLHADGQSTQIRLLRLRELIRWLKAFMVGGDYEQVIQFLQSHYTQFNIQELLSLDWFSASYLIVAELQWHRDLAKATEVARFIVGLLKPASQKELRARLESSVELERRVGGFFTTGTCSQQIINFLKLVAMKQDVKDALARALNFHMHRTREEGFHLGNLEMNFQSEARAREKLQEIETEQDVVQFASILVILLLWETFNLEELMRVLEFRPGSVLSGESRQSEFSTSTRSSSSSRGYKAQREKIHRHESIVLPDAPVDDLPEVISEEPDSDLAQLILTFLNSAETFEGFLQNVLALVRLLDESQNEEIQLILQWLNQTLNEITGLSRNWISAERLRQSTRVTFLSLTGAFSHAQQAAFEEQLLRRLQAKAGEVLNSFCDSLSQTDQLQSYQGLIEEHLGVVSGNKERAELIALLQEYFSAETPRLRRINVLHALQRLLFKSGEKELSTTLLGKLFEEAENAPDLKANMLASEIWKMIWDSEESVQIFLGRLREELLGWPPDRIRNLLSALQKSQRRMAASNALLDELLQLLTIADKGERNHLLAHLMDKLMKFPQKPVFMAFYQLILGKKATNPDLTALRAALDKSLKGNWTFKEARDSWRAIQFVNSFSVDLLLQIHRTLSSIGVPVVEPAVPAVVLVSSQETYGSQVALHICPMPSNSLTPVCLAPEFTLLSRHLRPRTRSQPHVNRLGLANRPPEGGLQHQSALSASLQRLSDEGVINQGSIDNVMSILSQPPQYGVTQLSQVEEENEGVDSVLVGIQPESVRPPRRDRPYEEIRMTPLLVTAPMTCRVQELQQEEGMSVKDLSAFASILHRYFREYFEDKEKQKLWRQLIEAVKNAVNVSHPEFDTQLELLVDTIVVQLMNQAKADGTSALDLAMALISMLQPAQEYLLKERVRKIEGLFWISPRLGEEDSVEEMKHYLSRIINQAMYVFLKQGHSRRAIAMALTVLLSKERVNHVVFASNLRAHPVTPRVVKVSHSATKASKTKSLPRQVSVSHTGQSKWTDLFKNWKFLKGKHKDKKEKSKKSEKKGKSKIQKAAYVVSDDREGLLQRVPSLSTASGSLASATSPVPITSDHQLAHLANLLREQNGRFVEEMGIRLGNHFMKIATRLGLSESEAHAIQMKNSVPGSWFTGLFNQVFGFGPVSLEDVQQFMEVVRSIDEGRYRQILRLSEQYGRATLL